MSEPIINCTLSVVTIFILCVFTFLVMDGNKVNNGVQYRIYAGNKTLSADHPDYWVLRHVHNRLNPVVDFVSDIAKLIQCGYEVRVEEVGISDITPATSVRFDFRA